MKTQTNTTQDTLSELRDFVATQAVEDAELPRDERRYQASIVKDVLKHEPLKSREISKLVHEYSAGVVRHLKTV